jgi:hypothetical protein
MKARKPRRRRGAPVIDLDGVDDLTSTAEPVYAEGERTHVLTGGDVDADATSAESTGEEAVGGSVATPDQDVVDEIGRALGVEQPDEEEFHPSSEILDQRDRYRWHLERDAADAAEGRRHRRRGAV